MRAADSVAAMAALDAMSEVEKTSLFGTAVHAVLRSNELTGDELRVRLGERGIAVQSIVTVAPSLEDVFLDVVDRARLDAPGGAAA